MRTLVLASGSPRRKEMLTQCGVKFVVDKSDLDESLLPGEEAEAYVARLAGEKALRVAQRHTGEVVLAADTTVVCGSEILGKPVSKTDGARMLELLSGSLHLVLTGVAIVAPGETETFVVTSKVHFREVTREEVDWYWRTGEPQDKAGGYGLQGIGAMFVESIEGSYTNVIGLPLAETIVRLRKHGIACIDSIDGGLEELNVIRDESYV